MSPSPTRVLSLTMPSITTQTHPRVSSIRPRLIAPCATIGSRVPARNEKPIRCPVQMKSFLRSWATQIPSDDDTDMHESIPYIHNNPNSRSTLYLSRIVSPCNFVSYSLVITFNQPYPTSSPLVREPRSLLLGTMFAIFVVVVLDPHRRIALPSLYRLQHP